MVVVDGTSASSPLIAGYINLLNDALIAQGKPTLGFLNPLLYKLWREDNTRFRDVTIGDNGCQEDLCCSHAGFLALPGFDASTGLGSPRLDRIAQALGVIIPSKLYDRSVDQNNDPSKVAIVIGIIAMVLVVFILIVGLRYLYRRYRSRKQAQQSIDSVLLPSPVYYSIQA